MIYGYPSTGGILPRSVRPVELAHLELDRFADSKPSPNADEEDEFCWRFRRIGAQWWASRSEYVDAMLGEAGNATSIKFAKRVQTGWPSSGQGVWAFVYSFDSSRQDRESYKIYRAADALNMDERC